jgi:mutual gliding-motility protein MglA
VAVIDIAARRIDARVVFFGPGGGGKTTSLRRIAAAAPHRVAGAFVTLAGADGRTLFLDGLPLDLGEVAGWRFRLDLVGVPGQPAYERTRRALLAGADGVVFVADSDPRRRAANRASLDELAAWLAEAGQRPGTVPLVVQLNKRDLPDAVPEADLLADLGLPGAAAVPTVATAGDGVLAALRAICRQVARSL